MSDRAEVWRRSDTRNRSANGADAYGAPEDSPARYVRQKPHVRLRFRDEHGAPGLYIDNYLPLTVELLHQLGFFILSCKPISYCRFKRIDVYIL